MDASYTGNQISQRRKALGLTQKALAEKLNVTDKAVSKWERGLNFPDLGLMESLAAALETTPACLLGLESADQNEIVASMTEISSEQLEIAQKDMRLTGWCCIVAAVLLVLVYQWIPRQQVQAYQTLHCLITAAIISGIWILFKYREIRALEPEDLLPLFGALTPALLYLFIQFVTGHDPHPLFGLVLIGAAACCVQIFFCRILRPVLAKALPLILSGLFGLWQLWIGNRIIGYFLPVLCCGAVFLLWLTKKKLLRRPTSKAIRIGLCILLAIALIAVFLFYPQIVRGYVLGAHDHLEAYALEALEAGDAGSYGFWNVSVYPEAGMVEFRTGGSGLAPGSTYEGFYYSASDSHTPFMGLVWEMDVQGDTTYWYDDPETSDNWCSSIRITDHFYWFEAHF